MTQLTWLEEQQAKKEQETTQYKILLPLIFETLNKLNVKEFSFIYEGSGDSGCFESIAVEYKNNKTDTGSYYNKWKHDVPDFVNLNNFSYSLQDIMAAIAEWLLESNHSGWENNEGGRGEVVFNVKAQTVELNHVEYHLTEELYQTEFN